MLFTAFHYMITRVEVDTHEKSFVLVGDSGLSSESIKRGDNYSEISKFI